MFPIATETHHGAVRIGTGLAIDDTGLLSAETQVRDNRYGLFDNGAISRYEPAQYMGQWLVMYDGELNSTKPNVATLQVGPSSSGGVQFPVLVDGQQVGNILFGQRSTTGVFTLPATTLKPGQLLVVGVPASVKSGAESQASGIVLILVS